MSDTYSHQMNANAKGSRPPISHEVAVAMIVELTQAKFSHARIVAKNPALEKGARNRMTAAVRALYRALTAIDPTPDTWDKIVREL